MSHQDQLSLEALKAAQLEKHPSHKCRFWLQHKRKYCSFAANPGAAFCGNHLYLGLAADDQGESSEQSNTKKRGRRPCVQRVPCPIDPRHTVAVDQLDIHVSSKCPALARRTEAQASVHFHQDINAGSEDEVDLAASSQTDPPTPAVGCTTSPFAPGRAAARQAAARCLGKGGFMTLVQRLQAAYQQECGDVPPLHELKPDCLEELLAAQEDTAAAKHTIQAASIAGQLLHLGLLPLRCAPGPSEVLPPPLPPSQVQGLIVASVNPASGSAHPAHAPAGPCSGVLVELGAGKGTLSRTVAAVPQHMTHVTSVVMVDNRAAFKCKADRHMRHLHLQRITLDLKDLDVHKLAVLQPAACNPKGESSSSQAQDASPDEVKDITQTAHLNTPQPPHWLVMAKHLCGAATDFGLRATLRDVIAVPDQPQAPNTSTDSRLKGLAIATCCHHRCGWKSYVGKAMFRRLGFTPLEFEILSWMTGWALCGHDCAPGQADEEGGQTLHDEEDGQQQAAQDDDTQGFPDWDPAKGLPRAFKMQLGAMAKLLIDRGRLLWVSQRLGLADRAQAGQWMVQGAGGDQVAPPPCRSRFAGILRYVEESVSGENKLLVAGL